MFMRFKTDIKNGESERTMFTDNAGLGMVERIYSEQTAVPGNLFPVTESVFIQDSKSRYSFSYISFMLLYTSYHTKPHRLLLNYESFLFKCNINILFCTM